MYSKKPYTFATHTKLMRHKNVHKLNIKQANGHTPEWEDLQVLLKSLTNCANHKTIFKCLKLYINVK